MAPPTPCRARAAISASMLGAMAAIAEPKVKIASPTRNMRLRPNRSPRAAPVMSSTAKVSVYALTVHSRPLSEAPRSCLITGSAVVTTRLSSDTMNTATDATTNVQIVIAFCDISLNSPDSDFANLVVTYLLGQIKRDSSAMRTGRYPCFTLRQLSLDLLPLGIGQADASPSPHRPRLRSRAAPTFMSMPNREPFAHLPDHWRRRPTARSARGAMNSSRTTSRTSSSSHATYACNCIMRRLRSCTRW